jgi:hypothetical protein
VSRSGRAAAQGGGGRVFAALVVLLAVALLAPSAASARGLKTGFSDSLFADPSASVRAQWLGNAKDERAGILRQNVNWAGVVGSRRPVVPTNPADPAYDFGGIDRAVRAASAQGFDLLLTVYDAPRWAEGKNRPGSAPDGTWKPSPKALGQFGQAIARRYSGHFLGLPKVRFFQAWNEPNFEQYLSPQWRGRKPQSPARFRRMLNAFYAGVKKGQRGASVVTGGTGPYGDPPGGTRMMPVAFWRNVFCLNRRLKGTKCPQKPHLDVLAHHPITDGNPARPALNRDNAGVADFHKIRRVLKAAERTHRIRPGGRHELWATELWWNTKPPNKFGFSVRKQAKWIEQAFYLLWKQGASVVINLEIRDAALTDPASSLQSGTFFHNGKKKPSYRSFRFPFVTHRTGRRNIRAWGKSPDGGKLKVQRKSKRGWRTLRSIRVRRGEIFNPEIRQRGPATFRGKVGSSISMPWHQGG